MAGQAATKHADAKGRAAVDGENNGHARVLEVAIQLFADKGFTGTGIREVATEAGMVSASLYHWFSNKEALLLTIMERGQLRINACSDAALAGLTAPDARLAAIVRTHVAVHARRKLEARVVDTEVRALSKQGLKKMMPLRDTYERSWHDIIAAGVRAGVFVVPDVRLARLALLQMCSGVSTWYDANGDTPLADICDDFALLALSMVSKQRVTKRELKRLDGPDVSAYLALVDEYYALIP